MKKNIVVLALLIFSTSACTDGENTQAVETFKTLNARVDELSSKLDEAQQQINDLKSAGASKREESSSAILLSGSNEQKPFKTETGSLTVSLKSIKAEKNGASAEILIGNPQAATITGMKFMLEYGSLDSDGAVVAASQKSREVTLSKKLKAGTNTPIKLNLEGITPDQVHYLILTQPQFKQLEFRMSQ